MLKIFSLECFWHLKFNPCPICLHGGGVHYYLYYSQAPGGALNILTPLLGNWAFLHRFIIFNSSQATTSDLKYEADAEVLTAVPLVST